MRVHLSTIESADADQRHRDYSGLPLLKVITSANEEEVHRLKRVWVYGNASETGGGNFPFLFINGGAATLSGSPFGIAIICDTITHRQIQLLEHAGDIRYSRFPLISSDICISDHQSSHLCNGKSQFRQKVQVCSLS